MTSARLLFLSLLVLTFGFWSTAQAKPLGSIGSYLTFEKSNDGRNYESRQPFAIRGGFGFDFGDIYLEFNTFQEAQGTSMVQVAREHQELILWYRRIIYPTWKFTPYLAAGAGMQNEVVETSFGESSMRATGTPQGLAALAIGFRALIWKNLSLQLEGQAKAASNFAPNPMFGAGTHLGVSF